jgi:hypothetical protein
MMKTPANEVQITTANEVKKRPPIEGFSGGQYGFSKHAHQGMQHTAKIDQKRGLIPENKAIFVAYSDGLS